MEGSFVTKQQRHDIALRLRSTHFNLGQYQNNFSTSSKDQYQKYMQGFQDQSQQFRNKNKTSSVNLGSNQNSMKVETEHAYRYKMYQTQKHNGQQSQKNQRSHHFSLGQDKNYYDTTNQQLFKNNHNSESPQKNLGQRNSNISLGVDKPYNTSFSQTQHSPKQAQGVNADFAKQTALKSRKSNWPVQQQNFQFEQSENQASYAQKPISNNKGAAENKQKQQKTNINFGSFTNPTDSLSHQQHKGVFKPAQNFVDSQRKELRSAHFNFGNDQTQYTPTYNQHFKSQNIAAPIKAVNTNRNTQFVLGTAENNWNTTYQSNQIKQRPQSASRAIGKDKQSSIVLGFDDKSQQITTSRSFFTDYEKSNQTKQNAWNPSDHINLGQNHTQFNTTYQQYGSKLCKPAKIDENRLKDLRSTHFQYGYQNTNNFNTSSSQQIPSKGLKNQLDQKTLNNIKQNHFYFDGHNQNWGTMYKSQFTWVKPTAEKNLKFTI